MATITRVYPLAMAENGQPLAGLIGVPAVTTDVATKAEADALVASGHFTFNAKDPRRMPAAPNEPTAPDEPTTTAPTPKE